MERLSNQEIEEASLSDWRKLAQALHARFATSDYVEAAGFAAAVVEVADAEACHPEVRIGRGFVDVSLCTREDGVWVTPSDIRMARRISAIAQEQGLDPQPGTVTQLEIALDTAHEDRVSAFWSVLLTGSPHNKTYDTVFDPTGRVPGLWFQETDEHPTPRQRWHFDLWVAPEAAGERIEAAIAAGGIVVDDSEAPSFTVLADPDGNRVCVCTSSER